MTKKREVSKKKERIQIPMKITSPLSQNEKYRTERKICNTPRKHLTL